MGSVLRYWTAGLVHRLAGAELPLGTFAVNVVGSFVVGLLMTVSLDRGVINQDARVLLTVGVCGGFTTMSTFSYETLALVRDGSLAMAGWNVVGTAAACLAAVWLGDAVGRFV